MQHKEIESALKAIRSISAIYPDDIAALVAALSCQINALSNGGNKLAQVSISELDNLANYLQDEIAFNEVAV